MGLFDSTGDALGGLDFSKIISATLPAAVTGIAAYNAPEPYGASQGYLDAKLAQDQAQFAANLELEKQKIAAASGAGNASAGAAIAVARINAATQMAALKERIAAQRLSAQLTAVQGRPDLMNQAASNLTSAIQNRGQNTQQGFAQIAQNLQGYKQ